MKASSNLSEKLFVLAFRASLVSLGAGVGYLLGWWVGALLGAVVGHCLFLPVAGFLFIISRWGR